MPRTFLSGGSGFIAAHVLDVLLERGHSVVTSVRSQSKGQTILENHPNTPKAKLDFVVVEDIAQPGAFDEAIKSDPPFDTVVHAASPYHFNVTDTKKDLLDPAIIGTTGILKAIKKNAPTVKRVVITSSFAAIVNSFKGNYPGHVYSEADWNPITEEEAGHNWSNGYRASKTLAEKAAWEFVEQEKPNFSLATINPPMVFGPIHPYLQRVDSLNTSNQRIAAMMTGKSKEAIPPTGVFLWVDVRDVALAHVNASELPAAANKRFFTTAGYFSNEEIADAVRENFPELRNEVPAKGTKGGEYPTDGLYKYDNSRAREVLGIQFRSLQDCIIDTVKSLQTLGV